uniref:MGDG synthase family glycosyltransferase n=1 Tax=Angelakisella sp. TaxID=1935177 RepID=UPI004029BF94
MKVLILTCNTGGGHNAAAAALRRELESRGHTCAVADALSFGPKHFSEAISHLHTIAYRYFPKIYGAGYRKKEERVLGEDETSFEYKMNAICVPQLYRYLLSGGFDAIVTPHVFPAEMLTRLRRKYEYKKPFYFIATDYTCSPCVDEITPDYWVIPDERLIPEFTARGIPEDRLLPLGIPTNPAMAAHVDRNVARRLLHLPQQGEMVLVMSGSIGCGPMTTLALKLLRRLPKDSFVVVICGKNKGDLKELQRYAKFLERLYPVGFTDRMDLYYSAADLVVGKPGGLSCTEIAQKGVPAVLMLSVPGCESRNLEFFTRYGMALGTESVRDTLSAVRRLLSSAAMRNRMMLAQRSIPRGAVAAITDLIEKGTVPLPAKEE